MSFHHFSSFYMRIIPRNHYVLPQKHLKAYQGYRQLAPLVWHATKCTWLLLSVLLVLFDNCTCLLAAALISWHTCFVSSCCEGLINADVTTNITSTLLMLMSWNAVDNPWYTLWKWLRDYPNMTKSFKHG